MDLAMILREGGSRHGRERGERDLENNGEVGRRAENEPEWDFFAVELRKGFEFI